MRSPKFENGVKKGLWSREEDQRLIAALTCLLKRSDRVWNWTQIPIYAGLLRNGKSCRLRWVNYLCPTVKRGNMTKKEEDIIISLHQTLGNKWSAIALKLPGRSDNEVKNHWNGHLKKRVENINNKNRNTKKSEVGSCTTSESIPSSSSSSSISIGGGEEEKIEVNSTMIDDNEWWEELPDLVDEYSMDLKDEDHQTNSTVHGSSSTCRSASDEPLSPYTINLFSQLELRIKQIWMME